METDSEDSVLEPHSSFSLSLQGKGLDLLSYRALSGSFLWFPTLCPFTGGTIEVCRIIHLILILISSHRLSDIFKEENSYLGMFYTKTPKSDNYFNITMAYNLFEMFFFSLVLITSLIKCHQDGHTFIIPICQIS